MYLILLSVQFSMYTAERIAKMCESIGAQGRILYMLAN